MLYDALGIAIAIDSPPWFREMLTYAAVGPTAAQAMFNCKFFAPLLEQSSADIVEKYEKSIQIEREKMGKTRKIEEVNEYKKERREVPKEEFKNPILSYGYI
jgi:hypothetical protein